MRFDGEAWKAVINETVELLRANHCETWAEKLSNAINSPTYVKTFFGGMGSLNDIGLRDPASDKRLTKLLNKIYALSHEA